MPQLYLPAAHTDADLVLASQIAARIDSAELHVAWSPERGQVVPEVAAVVRPMLGAWRGLPGLSYWAAVPHYVSQTPCPKATVALLRRLEDLLDLAVPLGDLPEQARAWERGVAELAAEDPDVAEYVRTLEAEQEATELPEASGDAIAKEFERYLRRNEHGDR